MTKQRIAGFICGVMILGIIIYFKPMPVGYIYFMSLKDGESILIEDFRSRQTVLIDTGGLLDAPKLLYLLSEKGIRKIDHLVLTHTHPDHIGSIAQLFQQVRIGKIYDNGSEIFNLAENSALYEDYLRLVRRNKNYSVLKKSDKFTIGKLDFEVLWPPWPLISGSPNVNSLVLILRYKGFSCLFTGDIDAQVETRILGNNPGLKTNVLKIAHHGSDAASTEGFIKSVAKQAAIVSVGTENKYNYPSEATLRKIKQLGLKLYRTDLNADILVTIYKRGNYTITRRGSKNYF